MRAPDLRALVLVDGGEKRDRCRKVYIGTSANGNGGRYHSYAGIGRQNCGLLAMMRG